MEEYGTVKYRSTGGLGVEVQVRLYKDRDGRLYVGSFIGSWVEVQWVEEGSVVGPKA